MKTLKFNLIFAFFGLFFFTACNSGGSEQQVSEQEVTGQPQGEPHGAGDTYTCPMHPEVVSTEPGKCPKCGMFLEKVGSAAAQDSTAQHQHQPGDQH